MDLPFRIAAAAIFVGVAGCSSLDERYPLSEPSCAIALGYMKRIKLEAPTPIAVGVASADLGPSREQLALFLEDRPNLREHPDVKQAYAEADVREVSVVRQCPEVRAWLIAEHVVHDDDQIERATRSISRWSYSVLQVSAPVISHNGDYATFYASESWDASGATLAVRYRRDSRGRWILEREIIVEIS
jgi:hypothetical protein